jgi:hypothetical protein
MDKAETKISSFHLLQSLKFRGASLTFLQLVDSNKQYNYLFAFCPLSISLVRQKWTDVDNGPEFHRQPALLFFFSALSGKNPQLQFLVGLDLELGRICVA